MKKNNRRRLFFFSFFKFTDSPTLRRLICMLILTGLIPALIIFIAMYSISSSIMREEIQDHSRDVLMDASNQMNDIIRQVEDIALNMSINNHVNTLLTANQLSVGSADRAALRSLVENTLKMNRSILNMFFIETDTDTVYSYVLKEDVSPYDIRITGSEYEQQVVQKNGAIYWFDTEDRTIPVPGERTHDNRIRCASAIYDANGTKCIGIVSMFVRTSAFDACLYAQNKNNDEQQILLLLDRQNRLIASNQNIPERLAGELLSVDFSVNHEDLTLEDTPYLSASMPCKQTGWRIVSLIPRSAVTQGIRASTKLLLPLLLMPFICVLLVYFFARRLLLDLNPMMQTMAQIKHGNLSVRVPSVQDSAIDIFGQALNEALDHYHEVMLVSGQQKELLTISRLKILRGQLSPHFLYNMLDSVNWMLLENGQMETSRIITDMGYILRYSIDESSDTVPLQKEIEVIKRYLSVSQNRFESRLHYSICVSPMLTDYEIPRFLLQPIVENAVIHGVEKMVCDSNLTIRCYTTESEVVIDVANNGPSIPPQQKADILNSFAHTAAPSTHIGLQNVYERIQLFYGPQYGLTLLDMEPQGTIVRLRLPLPQNHKEVTQDECICD